MLNKKNIIWTSPGGINITAPFAAELINSTRSHPRSRSYTAQELSRGTNELVSAIASNSEYQ